MILRILDYLVRWWVRRCLHAAAQVVVADNEKVSYCCRCGSMRVESHSWKSPDPVMFPQGGGPL